MFNCFSDKIHRSRDYPFSKLADDAMALLINRLNPDSHLMAHQSRRSLVSLSEQPLSKVYSVIDNDRYYGCAQ